MKDFCKKIDFFAKKAAILSFFYNILEAFFACEMLEVQVLPAVKGRYFPGGGVESVFRKQQ